MTPQTLHRRKLIAYLYYFFQRAVQAVGIVEDVLERLERNTPWISKRDWIVADGLGGGKGQEQVPVLFLRLEARVVVRSMFLWVRWWVRVVGRRLWLRGGRWMTWYRIAWFGRADVGKVRCGLQGGFIEVEWYDGVPR
jgi:hypothetical protein